MVRQASPDNIEVRLTLSDAYIMLNRSEDAIAELEAGVRALPNNKELRMKLVNLYVDGPHPRLTAALKLLQDVDTVPPFNKDAEIFQNESIILAKLADKNNALAKAEIARQLSPDDVAIVRTEMQLLLDMQNYQGVFDRYAELTDKMKSSSWALWDLALAEKRTNNPQSLADFNRAMTTAEKDDQPVVLDALARTVAQEFSYDDAVNSLLPISKEYVSAKVSLARLYQGHGDDAAALATVDGIMADFDKLSHRDQVKLCPTRRFCTNSPNRFPWWTRRTAPYQQWLKLEPDNLEALNNMACLLADNYSPPRTKEGLDYANHAVSEMSRLGRTEPRLLDTQAWLMILTGTPEDGVHTLNTAMTSSRRFPTSICILAKGICGRKYPIPRGGNSGKVRHALVNRRNAADEDANVRAKLQDLINRSEEMRHARQQAQVP